MNEKNKKSFRALGITFLVCGITFLAVGLASQPSTLNGLVQIWPFDNVIVNWPPKIILTHTKAKSISDSLHLRVLSLAAKNVPDT